MRRCRAVLLAAMGILVATGAPVGRAAEADRVALVRAAALPLDGGAGDYDGLLESIGDAALVMLGEATHGSAEFYRERARITRRLIEDKGFDAVVFEAPWEPMRQADAWVRGGPGTAEEALAGIVRFPSWTWRNTEVRDFLAWLRERNGRHPGRPARVYGMDLYSLPESADAVAGHLAAAAPEQAEAARLDYRCFDAYRGEPQDYGQAVEIGHGERCGAGSRRQLALMQLRVEAAGVPDEALFAAWQSAHTVAAAEHYYRAMYRGGEPSWNVRERHMAATQDRLRDWLKARGGNGKLVVWAHNIHQGDARATDQAAAGEVSLGQLMRERHGDGAFLVGFTLGGGRVRAATRWGGADAVKTLRPPRRDSWSGLMGRTGMAAFLLLFRDRPALAEALASARPERAVGVIYLPRDEWASHYFRVALSRQFDAVIHQEATTPLVPLP